MKPFHESSTLAQIRRLRQMAEAVLQKYPIKVRRLDFIHHGENATFKVHSREGDYLLRLHRDGYHTKAAILEELQWMRRLSGKTQINVQNPVHSVDNNLVETQHAPTFANPRHCDLLEWREGQIRHKGIRTNNFYSIGQLLAKLNNSTENIKVKHRRYWMPEKLIGKTDTKLGDLTGLKNLYKKEFPILDQCRAETLRVLTDYAKKNQNQLRLIHADLHFGNMIWRNSEPSPIDFDDCGLGFPAYDLAVVLYASGRIYKQNQKKEKQAAFDQMLEGYISVRALTAADIRIIPHFILARRIAMLGWLYQRRDNPRFIQVLKENIPHTMQFVRAALKQGPTFP